MLSDEEKAVLFEVQRLPLVPNPFSEIAARIGLNEDKIIAICRDLLSRGLIRRLGLSLNHRNLGVTANLMVVAYVKEDLIDDIGHRIAAEQEITHCYYRTGWDYNLFFMIHSNSKKKTINIAKKILKKVNIQNYRFIFSIKEFKKTSFELSRQLNVSKK
ncbi:MAG: Lrp/AsnC family transcriptional regulator [Promethearchaeota archaeon]